MSMDFRTVLSQPPEILAVQGLPKLGVVPLDLVDPIQPPLAVSQLLSIPAAQAQNPDACLVCGL